MLGASLGRLITQDFGIGSSLAWSRESLGDASANAFTFDFGFLYFDNIYPLVVGFSIQNLGPKVKYNNASYDLPYLVRVGVSLHQKEESMIPLLPKGSLLSAELFRPLRGENSVRAGTENPLYKLLNLRAGYRYEFGIDRDLGSASNLPAGLTVGIGLSRSFWKLDFATASYGDMGFTHRLSVELIWDNPR